jgi:rare lipoprotein A
MTTAGVRHGFGFFVLLLALTGCAGAEAVTGPTAPVQQILDTQVGDATFYSNRFQGDTTASGVKFDNKKAVAAHRRYAFGTVVRVTNLENEKSVNVTILDRGPHGKNRREGAIIDLSRIAATQLGMIKDGQVKVRVDVLEWGEGGEANTELKLRN